VRRQAAHCAANFHHLPLIFLPFNKLATREHLSWDFSPLLIREARDKEDGFRESQRQEERPALGVVVHCGWGYQGEWPVG
jgi:hypothetical protein